MLNSLCKSLGDLESKCRTYVAANKDNIKDALSGLVPAQQICYAMEACGKKFAISDLKQIIIPFNFEKSELKRTFREKRLLGAEKCTWGPSFWCESEANMNKCNVS